MSCAWPLLLKESSDVQPKTKKIKYSVKALWMLQAVVDAYLYIY